jgi:anhydro-N-acetylmuramic acid kinase
MNSGIVKLNSLAGKKNRFVLGIMSGTSMDGLDLALCRIEGFSLNTFLEVEKFSTVKFSEELTEKFSQLAFNPDAPGGKILRFQAELNREWSRLISSQIEKWGINRGDIDLIASHGQTILHQPDSGGDLHATWQLVDGDVLAQNLGVITVSDFRQKHIVAGYEGAPLAPLAEVLLFQKSGEDRLLLNLGGIANFTILKGELNEPGVPFATDTGPANTLLDAAVKRLMPGKHYDDGGLVAKTGTINRDLLANMMEHPFFSRPFPKSTGQEDFNWPWLHELILKSSPDIKVSDLLSTLTEFTVDSISTAIHEQLSVTTVNTKIFVSGGGWNNEYLIERLQSKLPEFEMLSSAELGISPDEKEAALFAVLANETVAGPGWINRKGKRFTLGKISLP